MIFNAYQDTDKGIGGISIISCGHIFAQNGRRIYRPNGRCDYLLFYIAKGNEHFKFSSETVADEGSFVFFRPYEYQEHYHKDEKIGEFYYIHFNAPEDFDLLGFESFRVYSAKQSTEICNIFEDIIKELQCKNPAYEEICVSKFFNIVSLLKRKTEKETNQNNQYNDKISFAIQTMNKEYNKNHTLEEYAKMCNMSRFHFLRIFKSITGISPIEYRNKIRLDHAKELLSDGELSITEIGTKVGYPCNAYFCDAFKNKMGVSPSQYRKLHKEGI